ncbi:MAG: hypothetical protein V3G42_15865, partial [Oscillospiraceae bacterium]
MKLNKRFLILLLLLFILILGFNSVGAADLSESGDDGTADLSLDDDLIMETTDSLPASNMDALDEGQDSIQVLNNDAFNEGQDSLHASNEDVLKDNPECIYVSKNGNDANDGSMESPVGTVSKAIELAINNETGCYRIFVLEGRYEVYNVDLDSTYLTIEGSGIGKTIFDGMGYT